MENDDDRLDAFEEAWLGSPPPRIRDYIAGDLKNRVHLLTELIKIDIEFRWRQSAASGRIAKLRLEDYFREFNDLGPIERCPVELIEQEYRVRAICKDAPSVGEYLKRFPENSTKLAERLREAEESIGGFRLPGDIFLADVESSELKQESRISAAEFLAKCNEAHALADPRAAETLLSDDRGTWGEFATRLQAAGLLTRYQAEKIECEQWDALVLGGFALLDRAPSRGKGTTFHARQRSSGRSCVVRLVPDGVLESKTLYRRFRERVKVASRLKHPNLVRVHGIDTNEEVPFLVLDDFRGDDLDTVVRRHGPMPLDDAVQATLQAALGLQYAHEHNVQHGDVRPGNLARDVRGRVKVLETGLATLPLTDAALSNATLASIAPEAADFLAPEAAAGIENADHRSDIYSLGMTLWFLLTGRSACSGRTIVDRIQSHRSATIPAITSLREDVPMSLSTLSGSMIAIHPGDRPQSMQEVVAGLQSD